MSIDPRVSSFLPSLPSAVGKRVVVTGANTGLGLETARFLALKGAEVVMTARDLAKGEAARRDVLADAPDASVKVERLDLASLASVRAFAERLGADAVVDVLINNAGIMALPRSVTEDGFESQFGVNHLGHFALTGLLLPALLRAPGARVVTMTSSAAFMGRLDFDDLMGERRYDRWRTYGASKLANLLFARGLARRAGTANLDLRSLAAHPGLVFTQLQRNVVEASAGRSGTTGGSSPRSMSVGERIFLQSLTPAIGQSAGMGALPETFAALAADVHSGDLWGPRWLHARGAPVVLRGPRSGFDHALQDRLWEVSEALTGVRYP